MIKGTYIFYEDGKEIARHDNVITKFGKRFLTNFIAGNESISSKSMAFGIDSTAATDLDTRLGFEFYRMPVSFGSTDIQTQNETTSYSVVYKATIPQDVSGVISEVGIVNPLSTQLFAENGQKINFLFAIPITEEEVHYIRSQGAKSFLNLLESKKLGWIHDPEREPVFWEKI